MERKVILTSDGSSTIHLPQWNEQYHSTHGAIQEAYHVFIKNGLSLFKYQEISILEIGFGTGLNCLITYFESLKLNLNIDYVGIEAFPIVNSEIQQLNYVAQLGYKKGKDVFNLLHNLDWELKNKLNTHFYLTKRKQFFQEIEDKNKYNLIYFDAFGARVQPELWTVSIFEKMYESLVEGGVLVTYSSKGSVRRAMLEVGFMVEKLEGPLGKREMLRAIKKSKK